MKRTTKINLQQNTGPKKKLVMRFIQGALKGQEILLDTEELPIIFGKQEANQESGNMKNFRKIEGDKIVDKHFEIDYDKIGGTIMLRNLNFDCEVSCGLYKMLYNQEFYSLQPGDAFRIGSLEFLTERFNTAIIKDICHREHMEDYMSYVSQLFNIDNKVQITYYAVFDGHGGQSCAEYCAEQLHVEIKMQMEDVLTGIENAQDLQKCIEQCIRNSFQITDEKYAKLYPNQCKQCGTTAEVILLVGNMLYSANVGDARGILCRNGKPIDLSVDHKAKRPDELDRIKSQGGYIVYGRVLGRLAISRAFGDFDCKNIEMDDN